MTATVAVSGVSHALTSTALRERLHLAPEGAAALTPARWLTAGTRWSTRDLQPHRALSHRNGHRGRRRRATAALAELPEEPSWARPLPLRRRERGAAPLPRGGRSRLDPSWETHVAAQVRHAHRTARAPARDRPAAGPLFETAAAASKRIRTETSDSSGPTSIPSAAIAAAARIAAPLSECRLLVIGAGTIAKAAALNAGHEAAARSSSRTATSSALVRSPASRWARNDPRRTRRRGRDADVVVSATAAPGFILPQASGRPRNRTTARHLRPRAPARRRPAFRNPPEHSSSTSTTSRAWWRRAGPLRRADLERRATVRSQRSATRGGGSLDRSTASGSRAAPFLLADQGTHTRCPRGRSPAQVATLQRVEVPAKGDGRNGH